MHVGAVLLECQERVRYDATHMTDMLDKGIVHFIRGVVICTAMPHEFTGCAVNDPGKKNVFVLRNVCVLRDGFVYQAEEGRTVP